MHPELAPEGVQAAIRAGEKNKQVKSPFSLYYAEKLDGSGFSIFSVSS